MIGQTLHHYQIVEKLGEGGMGEVFKAYDPRLGRHVAVKRLNTQSTADESRKRRFLAEARAASALNHPNIVTIYDIFSDHGADFIAMELIEGRTLAQLGRVRPIEALKYGVQIADALSRAHRAGVIHRDIKPANIMVTAESLVKVLDFGLAKLTQPVSPDDEAGLTAATQAGMIIGTLAYMSPEQAEGRDQLDARSDIFSLGAVFYEILTGRQAFQGSSPVATLTAILRDEPMAPRNVAADVPPELERIILRCLRKDPDRRFQSMTEVKLALEELLDQLRVTDSTPSSGSRARAVDAGPSLAVLPFSNLSADKENEYFSDGLAEEILNALAKIPGLRVTARTSAFAFRGKEQDIRTIGETLGVRAVLEGSVRRAGNRVRVTAQLSQVADGYQVWSERYDREMNDVFAIQDEITEAIVATLKVKLLGDAVTAPVRPANVEAVDLMLQGRHHQHRWTDDGFRKAVDCFSRAVAVDPECSEAWSGLAGAYSLLGLWGLQRPSDAMPRAAEAARRALEIDEADAEAHGAAAIVKVMYERDWTGGAVSFQRAVSLSPGIQNHGYGMCYFYPRGQFDEAREQLNRALKFDPLNLTLIAHIGLVDLAAGRIDEALRGVRKALDLDPNFPEALRYLGWIHTHQGEYREAVAALEKTVVNDRRPMLRGELGHLYAVCGDSVAARRILAEYDDLARSSYISPDGPAQIHAGLGEDERAFELLEQAVEERSAWMVYLRFIPAFQRLHGHPRFDALLRRLGLPV